MPTVKLNLKQSVGAIVVVQAGFVYVGAWSMEKDNHNGLWYVLRDAYNIRAWGTTEGLGQLVNGPLADTKLDKCGTVRIPMQAVLSVIDIDDARWTKQFKK